MITIQPLEANFIGSGEVAGFEFDRVETSAEWYVYKVVNLGSVHYEVFKRKRVPICVDFEKRRYSDSDFKEVYPKAKDFGLWAWSVKSIERAIELMNE